MNSRELGNPDRFDDPFWIDFRRREEERRAVVSRRCLTRFVWAASLAALFSILSVIARF